MCGIAGAVFWQDGPSAVEHDAIVNRMVDALAHRGPDGRGLVRCTPGQADGPRATLGHTRLAIIDLSEGGRQPMADGRRPIWVTYNGEIYNFADLRAELESLGRAFRSGSDTEVLLQGYEQWGLGVVDRLDGMFAFAIWDGAANRLLLARDRLGIKPLYLWRTDRSLLFASEVRSLLASGLVERRLDPVALDQYLAYQSVPTPRTLVRNVEMLRPARIAIAGPHGSFHERAYWDPIAQASPDSRSADRAEARHEVHDLLVQSVRRHLVSDVPVGVFLSGGIDSGALVALMRQTGVVPRTFTIACPGTPYDEAPEARLVAASYGAEHTEIPLDVAAMRREIPDALANADHPSGDGANTFIVAHAVRQTGLKVALSGLGGDEFFGGYPSFQRLERLAPYARLWRRSPPRVRATAAAAVRTLAGPSVASGKAAALVESDGTLSQMFPILRQLFPARDRAELLGERAVNASRAEGDPYVALLADAEARSQGLGELALVCYAESRTYMHDVLLRDTDQMSMRHGLEVRVPLLDHHLVEYLMGLPDDARHGGATPKPLLVESLGEPLPAVCLRPKRGFVLPFREWMRGPLRAFCEGHLGADGLGGRGVMQAPAIEALWRAFLAGERRTSWSRPWTLVALDAWLEATGVGL
ncbi:MAG: asparagine synthase (glutamine-hydrolyzing) [Vicinamibacterales bacterium]